MRRLKTNVRMMEEAIGRGATLGGMACAIYGTPPASKFGRTRASMLRYQVTKKSKKSLTNLTDFDLII
ncbi:MAG TPA: hypothetical protein DCK87_03440 [Desulfotomaculum sp.]|nr:hypothetical protein [Desulfotomaculum sp.]